MHPLFIALLPIAGAAFGAWLQYLFGRGLEARKRLAQEKGQAYTDFFRSVAALATKGHEAEFLSQAADAKTRVCIYGSSGVALALSDFEKTGAKIDTKDGKAAIVKLMQEMRRDIGGRAQEIAREDLENILFGHVRKL